ncbi:MAG: CaiB/BaiF CoA transferase family protein [Candidatus Dormibacteraceae bacterium]
MALPLPLEGVTVVAVEQAVAAPLATRQLADLGARVIKIERPGSGDFARAYDTTVAGMSSHFVWTNRSKESLTLNLKDPDGLAILVQLISQADVFVQNLAPGAAETLGLGAERLRSDHPALIVCDISGYGSGGAYRDRRAYDLLIQCETGLLSITGSPESPAKAGISVADIAAAMYALSGILVALYRRERTGAGAALEVSVFDALAEWMGYPAHFTAGSGTPPPRTGARHAAIVPYGPFPSAKGPALFLAVQNEREWWRFCEMVLERPDLATDPRYVSNPDRVANRAELEAVIGKAMAAMPRDEAESRLEAAGIAFAHLNDMAGFIDHPQLTSRHRWQEIDTPGGRVPALLPPWIMGGFEPTMGPVPAVGEHTQEILAELGIDPGRIADLGRQGTI